MISQFQSGILVSPSTSRAVEMSLAMRALACMRHAGPKTYVAAPITGGPRFVEWYRRRGKTHEATSDRYLEELYVSVVEPNSSSIASTIQTLTNKSSSLLIDPSALSIDSWSQNDYRYFWSSVIEAFADQAIFLDGWHLSSGCAYEFLVSSIKQIPIHAQSGEPLETHEGMRLLAEGANELKDAGVDTEFFERVLNRLREFAGAGVG